MVHFIMLDKMLLKIVFIQFEGKKMYHSWLVWGPFGPPPPPKKKKKKKQLSRVPSKIRQDPKMCITLLATIL